MKLKAPDDDEIYSEDKGDPTRLVKVSEKNTFEEEIRDILTRPKKSSKHLVDGPITDTPDFKLQVLLKFTEFHHEEVIPRHNRALSTIQMKLEELQCTKEFQQREQAYLTSTSQELKENMLLLESKKAVVLSKHQELNERLKETLLNLQSSCKNKTLAEKTMAQDLVKFQEKASDLKVNITESASKANYYSTQIKAQAAKVEKHVKPLHLDKSRSTFIKTNLNSTRQNIEELVRRVKNLKLHVSEIIKPEYPEVLPKTEQSKAKSEKL